MIRSDTDVVQKPVNAGVTVQPQQRVVDGCEAQEALSYNSLVQSWPEITRVAREGGKPRTKQVRLFKQE